MIKILIHFTVFLILTSCMHNRVTINKDARPAHKKEVMTAHFVLLGFIPTATEFESNNFCGKDGVYQYHSYFSFTDFLLGLVTMFLYSPRTLEVICIENETSYRIDSREPLKSLVGEKDSVANISTSLRH